MKNLYALFLLFASTVINAQNWQTVYSDRVQYFDSSRQAIKIIHKYVDSAGDSVFRNYSQYLIDSSGRFDRPQGKLKDSSSWIGRRVIIKPDGYNGFWNNWEGITWLNTKAGLNDSFIFAESNKITVTGKCDRLYFVDTFGIKDSVKHFVFLFSPKPGFNAKFNGDISQLEILLSKHHGLLTAPAFSKFYIHDSLAGFSGDIYNYSPKNYFTNYYFNHAEIGDEFEYTIKDRYNPFRQASNEWKRYLRVIDTDTGLIQDSVVITYVLLEHYKYTLKNASGPPSVYINTKIDTVTKTVSLNNNPVNGLMPQQLITLTGSMMSYLSTEFILTDTCSLVIGEKYYAAFDSLTKQFDMVVFPSGGVDNHSKIGPLQWWYEDAGTIGPYYNGREYSIDYKNFCNSQTGTPFAKYTVFPKSVNELNNKTVYVYPNPATTTVTITVPETSSINLTDLQGREIPNQFTSRDSETATLDVSGMANGIYLLHIHSGNSITTHKLVVQH